VRISHRRVRIEIEQTTVRLQWGEGQLPADGGQRMAAEFLAASRKLLDQPTSSEIAQPAEGSDPCDENP
jgi:hypothetical protein